jgi:outer membrane cobalamin receptor
MVAALVAPVVWAALFGSVRVTVRDPQGLAVPKAEVVVRDKTSAWSRHAVTDANGQVVIEAVPIGRYLVSATAAGLNAKGSQEIGVNSDTVTSATLDLSVEGVRETVSVSDVQSAIHPESSTTESLTTRMEIEHGPDEDRTGSMAMITNNVPGTYVMHDHLHSRGGHGVTWQIDGVPVPNSNLASVGAQFDPKDVQYLEVQRGGYSAQYGDRSYGVFNVVPRNGFEGERFGEFSATYGSRNQTNEYLNFGSHTNRFAYYGSLAGSRTDLGLERPDLEVLHDQSASFSGFTSLIFNRDARNQFRFVASSRRDHYQVPNIPEQQADGNRDVENADDSLANFSWVHMPGSGWLITVSPYYHYNRGHYIGGAHDVPITPEDDHTANYAGGYATAALTKKQHTARFGTDSYFEHDHTIFGIKANDGTGLALQQTQAINAGVAGLFAEDQFRATRWLTLNGGIRYTHFNGTVTESAATPRAGAAIRIPRINWVVRGSYGRYYQHPPLNTVAGPLLEFAVKQGFGFLPVPGERDETWEVGLGIPVRGWTLDFVRFHNNAGNPIDHSVLGNSNLLFPVSISRGRIYGEESTLHSPTIARRVALRWALSHQTAQARGDISGGLTDFAPPPSTWFYMDHDQRVTLSAGYDLTLPRRLWASGTVQYGSGFVKGDGPEHMPQHTTFDLSAGRDFENWSVRATALNLLNNQFLTGFESSFAGTHYNYPREVSLQVRYRFHF